ncbi:MAG: YetF domain-containing protein [bacterium]
MRLAVWSLVIVRVAVIYFFALILVRIMGKRELARLSTFDFIIAIALGDIIGGPMVDETIPLDRVFPAIITVVLLEIATSYVTMKCERLRVLIDGRPTIVIEKGRIREGAMAAIRYNLGDLLGKLREKGIADVADVDYAIVETSGELSIIRKPGAEPLTRSDAGIGASGQGLPFVVIKDGQVMERDLRAVGYSYDWLVAELRRHGIGRPSDVVLATVQRDGNLYVDRREHEPPGKDDIRIE